MRERQAEEQSLGVVQNPLLHREHYGGEFLRSEQSILGSDIGGRGVKLQMSRIERGEIEGLGEQIGVSKFYQQSFKIAPRYGPLL
jgi:hypothetical protein